MYIPDSIKAHIKNEAWTADHIGLSGDSVLLFSDKVLKIRENTEDALREVRAMQWLRGRLSVPEVIAHACTEEKSYLLMSRLNGEMACSGRFLEQFPLLVERLAGALKELWRIPVADCPLNCSLDWKLQEAEFRVEQDLVDPSQVEPETFGPGGFETPRALLQWLKDHRPAEDLVLSHGDFCLPNLFLEDDGTVSFIDLGSCGAADRWQDLALCFRSLTWNSRGEFGGKIYQGNDPSLLFQKLGIRPDWKKMRYYTLLDELF